MQANGTGIGMDLNMNMEMEDGSRRRKTRDAWVVAGSENAKVVIWDLGSRRVLQVLETEGTVHSPIIAIAVSSSSSPSSPIELTDQVHPDGRTVATGSLEPDRIINIWRDA